MIIAEDVEQDALATLVVNRLRGSLSCVAVKAPGFGDRRKAMMRDMAILTGGQFIAEELGLKLENVGIESLGKAKRVIVDKDNTTIIGGGGDKEAINGRSRGQKYLNGGLSPPPDVLNPTIGAGTSAPPDTPSRSNRMTGPLHFRTATRESMERVDCDAR